MLTACPDVWLPRTLQTSSSSTGPIEFSLDTGPGNHAQVRQQKRSTVKSDVPHLSEKPGQTEGVAFWVGLKQGTQASPKTTQQPHRGRRGQRPSPQRAAVERPETTTCTELGKERSRRGGGWRQNGSFVCLHFSPCCAFQEPKKGLWGSPATSPLATAGHRHPPTHKVYTRSLADVPGPVL